MAKTPLLLESNEGEYLLDPYLEILEDKENEWGIEDVTSQKLSSRFLSVVGSNLGFKDSAYWLRFTIISKVSTSTDWMLEVQFPFLDNIELYTPNPRGGFDVRKAGRFFPFGEREVKHRNFIFHIKAPPGVSTQYIRLKTESAMFFPMVLRSHTAFAAHDHEAQFGLGFYYGIMLVMAGYNLFIFASLRDRAYLYYVLYVICFALYQMIANGLAYEYLWPSFPWWNRRSTIFFAAMAMFWALKFARAFLSSKVHAPLFDKILFAEMQVAVFLAVLSLFVSYAVAVKMALFLAAAFVPSIIVTGFVCWSRGDRSARYFLVAWLVFLGGIATLVVRNFGLIQVNFIVLYAIQIGSALEVVLLSLALADRINTMREERALAMEKAYEAQKKAAEQKESMVRDLHDGVGGLATNIHLLAEAARGMSSAVEVRTALGTIAALARDSLFEVRTFMKGLDQNALSWNSLAAELRNCGNNMIESHGVTFVMKSSVQEGGDAPTPLVWMNVFKIGREAFTNSMKHSGASEVRLAMDVGLGVLKLSIRDNGTWSKQTRAEGRGLSNMNKRARQIDGVLKISNDNGTEISLEVPLM